MFGHVDSPVHWARHFSRLRAAAGTGGFTEFVPLPYVPMEAPLHLRGQSRPGPTFREAVLMHAMARLVLHPDIRNIQTSWVKMGPEGASACLNAGANDLGGTLMNESITRAAGATHGQESAGGNGNAHRLDRATASTSARRSIGPVAVDHASTSFGAAPLLPPIETPARRYEHTVRASPGKAEHRNQSESAERTA